MGILLRLIVALLIGVVAYMLAHLVLNETFSFVIGILCGTLYFVGDRHI